MRRHIIAFDNLTFLTQRSSEKNIWFHILFLPEREIGRLLLLHLLYRRYLCIRYNASINRGHNARHKIHMSTVDTILWTQPPREEFVLLHASLHPVLTYLFYVEAATIIYPRLQRWSVIKDIHGTILHSRSS